MPSVKKIQVKEDLAEVKRVHKAVASHLKPRVQMLILALQKGLHSKNALADALGVDPNSIQEWKRRYEQGGLEELLRDKRGGKRPSKIDAAVHRAIEAKLSNPQEAPRSFTELQQWVDEHHISGINYHTLHKYVKRKLGAKLKVVRKTHVSKDQEAVESFKKKSRKR